MSEFVVTGEELKKLQEDASVSNAIKELANVLTGRADDLPHRFRAPGQFAKYMDDWATNSSYYTTPIYGSASSNPMTLQMTTRPTQRILEMVFQAADGTRLFTLEIEYGGE
jgi:hypothetical protein